MLNLTNSSNKPKKQTRANQRTSYETPSVTSGSSRWCCLHFRRRRGPSCGRHTFQKRTLLIEGAGVKAFFGNELKVLWLADSTTLVGVALILGFLSLRPASVKQSTTPALGARSRGDDRSAVCVPRPLLCRAPVAPWDSHGCHCRAAAERTRSPRRPGRSAMVPIELIGAPQSVFVRTTRMAFEEKGVAYSLTCGCAAFRLSQCHPPFWTHSGHAPRRLCAVRVKGDRDLRRSAVCRGPSSFREKPTDAALVEQWISAMNTGVFPSTVGYMQANAFPQTEPRRRDEQHVADPTVEPAAAISRYWNGRWRSPAI